MREFWTFRHAAWLGWQTESNWTDPLLFATYSVIRPITTTLMVVLMYWFVGSKETSLFELMFLGNTLYMYIFNVPFGISYVIMEDREHYKVLKYLYISPANIYVYLMGRGVSKFVITTVAVAITLAFGVLFLGVHIALGTINPLFLAASFVLGLTGLIAFGTIMAGISLLVARHNFYIGESLAGIFYLFCGVVFPISVLPWWGEALGKVIPITYWLEATRRSLLGFGDPTLAQLTDMEVFGILAFSTLLLLALSVVLFRAYNHVARARGVIDMTTWY
ncbi:MAG: ABC transporter permease [Euryarchaeota archaeon]|nr:ABC transporter permease [Euryarchaeota archaeon]